MGKRYLSDFNSPAPRHVPLSIRLRVLFGGFNNQFGWIFFGFGLVFVWVFAVQADLTSFILFRLQTKTTAGIIEDVQPTNASENEIQIYEVRYQYFDNLGRQQSGVSYTVGNPRVGGRANVEYVSAYPSISRVEGMRRAIFGPWAAFVVIFPLIGLGFLISGISYGIKANQLLSKGKISFGKLISTVGTGASVNNQPVLKLTFNFVSESGQDWDVVAKTHEPRDLKDEEQEPILYDPDDPSYAVLLDNLPGRTEFDDSGQLIPANFLEILKVLTLPILTVVGHGIYLFLSTL